MSETVTLYDRREEWAPLLAAHVPVDAWTSIPGNPGACEALVDGVRWVRWDRDYGAATLSLEVTRARLWVEADDDELATAGDALRAMLDAGRDALAAAGPTIDEVTDG